MTNATAIGFYNYESMAPDASQIRRVYEYLDSKLRYLGAEPTYFGVAGVKAMKKYGSSFHRKIVEEKFLGISGFGIYTNPAESDQPGYDYHGAADYNFIESLSENTLFFYVEDRFLAFASSKFEDLIFEMANLQHWNFGYSYSWPIERSPHMHLLGSGEQGDPEQERRLDRWYEADAAERRAKIRDVYPFNIINLEQLNCANGRSSTLREFIELDGASKLRQLSKDLELWTVEVGEVDRVRAELIGSGILIAE